ncbi:MAG: hypothetical protein ACK4N4_16340 [Burkholderiales bacterium]
MSGPAQPSTLLRQLVLQLVPCPAGTRFRPAFPDRQQTVAAAWRHLDKHAAALPVLSGKPAPADEAPVSRDATCAAD